MIVGAHGTNFDCIDSIREKNFNESTGADEWLGDGAYFFVDGCNSEKIEVLAEKWAIANSWDNEIGSYNCSHAACFNVDINVDDDKLLDLTVTNGKKLLNQYRDHVKQKLKETKRIKIKNELTDQSVLKMMKRRLGLEAVKGDFYIKFTFERKKRIESRFPNCTIIAVNNTQKNIDVTTIRNIKKIELEVRNGL
ncbi:hypothetical protein [Sphingobacterium thalpophilum]|uniref:hypothetical protein n=1 Tax=Sphingobacterium thalpophilum TaxID=259 RepID=UPI0024A74345|nr:hypothetical protein [Sphingobacterium thalpophilum]